MNEVRYLKTLQIGRGGSSKVFMVLAPDSKVGVGVRMLGGGRGELLLFSRGAGSFCFAAWVVVVVAGFVVGGGTSRI